MLVGGQAVLGRQVQTATPWLTEEDKYLLQLLGSQNDMATIRLNVFLFEDLTIPLDLSYVLELDKLTKINSSKI